MPDAPKPMAPDPGHPARRIIASFLLMSNPDNYETPGAMADALLRRLSAEGFEVVAKEV